MLEFWRKAINGLYKCVYDTISLTKHKIKDDFTINKITPYGMDNIIRELVNRGQLIPLEQLRSREYFRRKNAKVGWIKTGAKTMYAYTLGMFFSKPELIPDASYLACTGYLKSIYKRLQARLRVKNSSSGMRVLTSSALQAELRDLGVPESSQEAFLIYLEETSIVAKRSIDINTEQRIEFYKLPADSLVMAATDTAEISEKEKAYLILSTNIENLGKKLEALEKQIKNSLLEAQKAVKYKCARVAKLSLKQRSVYQEYWEKFTILSRIFSLDLDPYLSFYLLKISKVPL